MKIQTISFHDITYVTCPYEPSLKQSLMRMGLGFPIKIKQCADNRYHCVNGQKRMSAIHDILEEQPDSPLCNVSVIIVNHARTSSGTTMNHH